MKSNRKSPSSILPIPAASPADPASSPALFGVATPPTEDAIRELAYAIYESGGRGEGRDLENWLEAEAALTGRRTTA